MTFKGNFDSDFNFCFIFPEAMLKNIFSFLDAVSLCLYLAAERTKHSTP